MFPKTLLISSDSWYRFQFAGRKYVEGGMARGESRVKRLIGSWRVSAGFAILEIGTRF